MTKIRHLAFNDLRPNPDSENAPIFRANHSPCPQSAFPASPATLTSEQLQMFINKAQDILLLRHSTDTLAIDHPDSCASAPISPSAPATLQGIFSFLHTLCTRENSMNIHVLHSPGTSSVTVQTETSLKSHLSISETLIVRGRQYIKFDSLFISTYIEALKIIKHLKSLSLNAVSFRLDLS